MMEQNDDGICKGPNLVHFKIEKLHNITVKKERIQTQPRVKRQENRVELVRVDGSDY